MIEVNKEYETAIDVSLGQAAQNIVTENEFHAKKAIEYLKRNNLGRATFLPLTSIKPYNIDNNTLSRPSGYKG